MQMESLLDDSEIVKIKSSITAMVARLNHIENKPLRLVRFGVSLI
jgi:hypothetical protein